MDMHDMCWQGQLWRPWEKYVHAILHTELNARRRHRFMPSERHANARLRQPHSS